MKNNMTSKLFEAASSVNKGVYELSRETLIESQRIVEEESDEEIRRQLKGSKFCPRCGRRYNDYPAISRYDNKTEICPDCGVEEAMINFTGGHLSDPHVYDEEVKEEINESAGSDIVTIYLEINTDYDEERYRESGHSGPMPISYVTRSFKKDIKKALGHDNFKLKCVSERGPHGWPVYFVTGDTEDMKKVCGRFTTDDFESILVDDSIRDFYNKNKGKDLSPSFVSSDEVNESTDNPSSEDLEQDDKVVSEDKKKEIEDRIAELKLALEDEAISEDEKEDVKKEISDLENSLNECSSKENLNEDDSDDEDDEDDGDDLDDNKGDKSLLDSDNYQDVIQFLINDENEAIDGYNKAKDRLSNLLSEDEYTKYLEVIEHIISEENEHIEELTKVLNGEPVDLNYDKDSNEDEPEEITESSPVDSLDKDVMTDIEYIVKSFKEDNKSDEDILDEIKSRINDLDDGVLEDIMSSELYSFMKDNEEGKEVDFDSLISRMSDIFEEDYEEEEE